MLHSLQPVVGYARGPLIKGQPRTSCCQGTAHDSTTTAVDRRTALLLGSVAVGQLLSQDLSALADAESQQITNVFVAGSTGSTGRRVVQQLRAAGYKVRAGVRVRVHAGQ